MLNPLPQGERSSAVPLWLHGDGVEFSTDSVLAFSLGAVLCGAPSMDSSFLVFAWPKTATAAQRHHGASAWDEAFRAIARSFTALWEGRNPSKDWQGRDVRDGSAGTPIVPDGRRFCLWQLLGDLEYYANVLKMPHWGRGEFSWRCNCSKSAPGRSSADVRDRPGWVCHTVQQMWDDPPSSHPFLVNIPGPAPDVRPALDVLHIVDLGYAASLCGSVLHGWAFPPDAARRGAPARVAAVWDEIKEAYRQLGTTDRLSNLVLAMFCSPNSPWGSAPDLKAHAAEIRHLVPAMAVVAQRRVHGDEAAGHSAAALEHLARFYLLCDGQDFFLACACCVAPGAVMVLGRVGQ